MNEIELTGEIDDVKELQRELHHAIHDASDYLGFCERAHDVRFCKWEGQSEDGRKWGERNGRKVFPWEGSSDTRVRLADTIINDNVMLQMHAVQRGRLQAIATETTDMESGARVGTLLDYVVRHKMRTELLREVELALNWKEEMGFSVIGIFWDQETRYGEREITLEQLAAQAQQMEQETGERQWTDAVAMIPDKEQEEKVAAFLKSNFDIGKREARRIVRDLREQGVTTVPDPYIYKSMPRWYACRPFIDVFFPPETYHLQKARWIACRELLTVTELREKITTEGWDEEFVERAINEVGNSANTNWQYRGHLNESIYVNEMQDFVEIYRYYYKSLDEKSGTMRLNEAVIHLNIDDKVGKIGPHAYAHGEYPYIELAREYTDRPLIESRPAPLLCQTQQSEIKIQRDLRADRASISILPPLRVPPNRGKLQIVMGPATQVVERRAGEIGWMNPPPFDTGTIEIEQSARADVDEYFYRMGPKSDPVRVNMGRQYLIDRLFAQLTPAFNQTYKLIQQYMPAEEVARVLNTRNIPFSGDRQEIQGEYDLRIEFDVRDLDLEFLMKKLDMITKILPLDVSGISDRNKLMELAFRAIDPNLAEQVVREAGAVQMKEVEDEQVQFAKMAAGVEPPMKNDGQNHELRLQALQNIVQANPDIQQRMQQDEIFKKLVENRAKHHQFQLQQKQNAQIGRMGASQVLG